jgi:[histone H3]-lysine36 N-dimethyltransferase SETMAR
LNLRFFLKTIFSPYRIQSEINDWKILLTIAVYKTQIVAYDYLGFHQTMNATLFVSFLEDFVKPAIKKLRIGEPIILMDNARSHTAVLTTKYLKEQKWEHLPHPPYSPDLNPWLSP